MCTEKKSGAVFSLIIMLQHKALHYYKIGMLGKTFNHNSYVATADDMVILLKVFDYIRFDCLFSTLL